MKKIFVYIGLLVFSIGYSQEKEVPSFKKNELTINAPYLIAGGIDISYERLINEESGAGADILIAFSNDLTTRFSLTGFYRYYFGKKPACGFFVEGFGMLNQFDNTDGDDYYDYYDPYDPTYYTDYNEEAITDFALGFSVGAKWVTKKGFIFEIYGGIGRNLFNDTSDDYDEEIVGRGGINLGYRF